MGLSKAHFVPFWVLHVESYLKLTHSLFMVQLFQWVELDKPQLYWAGIVISTF